MDVVYWSEWLQNRFPHSSVWNVESQADSDASDRAGVIEPSIAQPLHTTSRSLNAEWSGFWWTALTIFKPRICPRTKLKEPRLEVSRSRSAKEWNQRTEMAIKNLPLRYANKVHCSIWYEFCINYERRCWSSLNNRICNAELYKMLNALTL